MKALARAISLALAGLISLTLLLAPFILIRQMSPTVHAIAPLMMWGTAGGFVHGLGFTPTHRIWQLLFSPWLAWPLMVGGVIFLGTSQL